MNRFGDLIAKIWNNPELKEPVFHKLAIYCMAKAAPRPQIVEFKGQDVEVQTGEFVLKRDVLTSDMNSNVSEKSQANDVTWWRRLQKLETEGIIEIRSTNKFSIVAIMVDGSLDEMPPDEEVAAGTEQIDPPQEPEKPPKEKKPKKEKIVKVYDDDDKALKMAKWIHKKSVEVIGESLWHYKADYQAWAADIDKLLNPSPWSKKPHIADTYEERAEIVKDVLVWIFEDGFWKDKIRTGHKFYEKFYDLRIKMESELRRNRDAGNRRPQNRQDRTKDFLSKKREQAEQNEAGDVSNLFLTGGESNDGEGIH